MVDHKAVGAPYVLGAQEIHTKYLRAHGSMERRIGLRPLLLGPPLTDRERDPTLTTLDSHLEGVAELLPKVYGDTEASQQAQMHFRRFLDMGHDQDGVLCKRAALLFALGKEKELGDYMAKQERTVQGHDGRPTYSEDMRDRVLPFILPRYIRNSCQCPDSFVVMACVLSELWAGEPLGNWPLRRGRGSSAP